MDMFSPPIKRIIFQILSKKILAVLTAGIYLYSALCAPLAEANFWTERKKATAPSPAQNRPSLLASVPAAPSQILSNLRVSQSLPLSSHLTETIPASMLKSYRPIIESLSPAYGTIRKVSVASGPLSVTDHRSPATAHAPLVIHIQDVHMNAEAQGNIGKTLQALIDNEQVDLVALEGAFEPIDLERFRRFPDHNAVTVVADYMLKRNEISGAIHAILSSAKPSPRVVGVDQKPHYDANVRAYTQSVALVKDLKDRISAMRQESARKKARAFNHALASFDADVEAYHRKELPLGEYVSLLAEESPSGSPDVKRFLAALDMENSMDFKQVERERAALIQELVGKMNERDLTELTNQSISYRLGTIRYSDFFRFIQGLCRRRGVDLFQFPAMNDYVDYVLLSDRIDSTKLFDGMSSLEEAGYAALVRTAEEKKLVVESKRLRLIGKLLDFSLTPGEWKAYRTVYGGMEDWGIGGQDSSSLDLSSFEAFYEEADARSVSMVDNIMNNVLPSLLPSNKELPVVVLVTGGFHSEEIEARLKERGTTVITFAPKITSVASGNGSDYLSVFTVEKTPLEKLLKGEELFLAQAPISGAAEDAASLRVTAATGLPPGFTMDQLARPSLRARIDRVYKNAIGDLIVTLRNGFQVTTHFSQGSFVETTSPPSIRARLRARGSIALNGIADAVFSKRAFGEEGINENIRWGAKLYVAGVFLWLGLSLFLMHGADALAGGLLSAFVLGTFLGVAGEIVVKGLVLRQRLHLGAVLRTGIIMGITNVFYTGHFRLVDASFVFDTDSPIFIFLMGGLKTYVTQWVVAKYVTEIVIKKLMKNGATGGPAREPIDPQERTRIFNAWARVVYGAIYFVTFVSPQLLLMVGTITPIVSFLLRSVLFICAYDQEGRFIEPLRRFARRVESRERIFVARAHFIWWGLSAASFAVSVPLSLGLFALGALAYLNRRRLIVGKIHQMVPDGNNGLRKVEELREAYADRLALARGVQEDDQRRGLSIYQQNARALFRLENNIALVKSFRAFIETRMGEYDPAAAHPFIAVYKERVFDFQVGPDEDVLEAYAEEFLAWAFTEAGLFNSLEGFLAEFFGNDMELRSAFLNEVGEILKKATGVRVAPARNLREGEEPLRLAILQNGPGGPQSQTLGPLEKYFTERGVEVHFHHSWAGKFPADLSRFDGVLGTGSNFNVREFRGRHWLEKMKEFIRAAGEAGVPFYGICFSHQLIAEAYGGLTGKADDATFDSHTAAMNKVEILDGAHPLFKEVAGQNKASPDGKVQAVVAEAHGDEVTRLPPGFTLIAQSESCAVEALFRGNMVGTQFHPELSLSDDGARVLQGFLTMVQARRGQKNSTAPDNSPAAIGRLKPLGVAVAGRFGIRLNDPSDIKEYGARISWWFEEFPLAIVSLAALLIPGLGHGVLAIYALVRFAFILAHLDRQAPPAENFKRVIAPARVSLISLGLFYVIPAALLATPLLSAVIYILGSFVTHGFINRGVWLGWKYFPEWPSAINGNGPTLYVDWKEAIMRVDYPDGWSRELVGRPEFGELTASFVRNNPGDKRSFPLTSDWIGQDLAGRIIAHCEDLRWQENYRKGFRRIVSPIGGSAGLNAQIQRIREFVHHYIQSAPKPASDAVHYGNGIFEELADLFEELPADRPLVFLGTDGEILTFAYNELWEGARPAAKAHMVSGEALLTSREMQVLSDPLAGQAMFPDELSKAVRADGLKAERDARWQDNSLVYSTIYQIITESYAASDYDAAFIDRFCDEMEKKTIQNRRLSASQRALFGEPYRALEDVLAVEMAGDAFAQMCLELFLLFHENVFSSADEAVVCDIGAVGAQPHLYMGVLEYLKRIKARADEMGVAPESLVPFQILDRGQLASVFQTIERKEIKIILFSRKDRTNSARVERVFLSESAGRFIESAKVYIPRGAGLGMTYVPDDRFFDIGHTPDKFLRFVQFAAARRRGTSLFGAWHVGHIALLLARHIIPAWWPFPYNRQAFARMGLDKETRNFIRKALLEVPTDVLTPGRLHYRQKMRLLHIIALEWKVLWDKYPDLNQKLDKAVRAWSPNARYLGETRDGLGRTYKVRAGAEIRKVRFFLSNAPGFVKSKDTHVLATIGSEEEHGQVSYQVSIHREAFRLQEGFGVTLADIVAHELDEIFDPEFTENPRQAHWNAVWKRTARDVGATDWYEKNREELIKPEHYADIRPLYQSILFFAYSGRLNKEIAFRLGIKTADVAYYLQALTKMMPGEGTARDKLLLLRVGKLKALGAEKGWLREDVAAWDGVLDPLEQFVYLNYLRLSQEETGEAEKIKTITSMLEKFDVVVLYGNKDTRWTPALIGSLLDGIKVKLDPARDPDVVKDILDMPEMRGREGNYGYVLSIYHQALVRLYARLVSPGATGAGYDRYKEFNLQAGFVEDSTHMSETKAYYARALGVDSLDDLLSRHGLLYGGATGLVIALTPNQAAILRRIIALADEGHDLEKIVYAVSRKSFIERFEKERRQTFTDNQVGNALGEIRRKLDMMGKSEASLVDALRTASVIFSRQTQIVADFLLEFPELETREYEMDLDRIVEASALAGGPALESIQINRTLNKLRDKLRKAEAWSEDKPLIPVIREVLKVYPETGEGDDLLGASRLRENSLLGLAVRLAVKRAERQQASPAAQFIVRHRNGIIAGATLAGLVVELAAIPWAVEKILLGTPFGMAGVIIAAAVFSALHVYLEWRIAKDSGGYTLRLAVISFAWHFAITSLYGILPSVLVDKTLAVALARGVHGIYDLLKIIRRSNHVSGPPASNYLINEAQKAFEEVRWHETDRRILNPGNLEFIHGDIANEAMCVHHPRYGTVVFHMDGLGTLISVPKGEKVLLRSDRYAMCPFVGINARGIGPSGSELTVAGIAHITDGSEYGGVDSFEGYIRLLDYLADPANGLTEVQIVLGLIGDYREWGLPDVGQFLREAAIRGIRVSGVQIRKGSDETLADAIVTEEFAAMRYWEEGRRGEDTEIETVVTPWEMVGPASSQKEVRPKALPLKKAESLKLYETVGKTLRAAANPSDGAVYRINGKIIRLLSNLKESGQPEGTSLLIQQIGPLVFVVINEDDPAAFREKAKAYREKLEPVVGPKMANVFFIRTAGEQYYGEIANKKRLHLHPSAKITIASLLAHREHNRDVKVWLDEGAGDGLQSLVQWSLGGEKMILCEPLPQMEELTAAMLESNGLVKGRDFVFEQVDVTTDQLDRVIEKHGLRDAGPLGVIINMGPWPHYGKGRANGHAVLSAIANRLPVHFLVNAGYVFPEVKSSYQRKAARGVSDLLEAMGFAVEKFMDAIEPEFMAETVIQWSASAALIATLPKSGNTVDPQSVRTALRELHAWDGKPVDPSVTERERALVRRVEGRLAETSAASHINSFLNVAILVIGGSVFHVSAGTLAGIFIFALLLHEGGHALEHLARYRSLKKLWTDKYWDGEGLGVRNTGGMSGVAASAGGMLIAVALFAAGQITLPYFVLGFAVNLIYAGSKADWRLIRAEHQARADAGVLFAMANPGAGSIESVFPEAEPLGVGQTFGAGSFVQRVEARMDDPAYAKAFGKAWAMWARGNDIDRVAVSVNLIGPADLPAAQALLSAVKEAQSSGASRIKSLVFVPSDENVSRALSQLIGATDKAVVLRFENYPDKLDKESALRINGALREWAGESFGRMAFVLTVSEDVPVYLFQNDLPGGLDEIFKKALLDFLIVRARPLDLKNILELATLVMKFA